VLSILLAGLILPAFASDQTGTAGFAGVRGTVVAADHHAVANAHVVAYSSVGITQTTTDASGHYYFLTLLPGTYIIRAYAQTASADLRPCSDDNPIELSAGQLYDATYELVPNCAYDAVTQLTAVR
jgi:hypothetical protein